MTDSHNGEIHQLQQAYQNAQKAGVVPSALAALGRAFGRGRPSTAWSLGLVMLVALWFDLATLACVLIPPNTAEFSALESLLIHDPPAGIVAWYRTALPSIEGTLPDLADAIREIFCTF